MKGVVEIYRGDNLLTKSSNMVVDGAAETIVDILTTNPALANTTASAILDVSNYTIQAISFGKESESYNLHAHHPDLSAVVMADGIIRIPSGVTMSSYEATGVIGVGVHPAPNPLDTRVEPRSTQVNTVSSLYDYGHNANMIQFSSVPNDILAGCYPASDGTTLYVIPDRDTPNSPIYQYDFSGIFNKNGYMDPSGFIRMDCSNVSFGDIIFSALEGRFIKKNLNLASDIWQTGGITYQCVADTGDYVFLSIFGGLKSVGLWTIDIKELVRGGNLPPYDLRNLTAPMKFKLFSKKILMEDLCQCKDVLATFIGYTPYTLAPPETNADYQLRVNWTMRF
jgi:hypothetical protein